MDRNLVDLFTAVFQVFQLVVGYRIFHIRRHVNLAPFADFFWHQATVRATAAD